MVFERWSYGSLISWNVFLVKGSVGGTWQILFLIKGTTFVHFSLTEVRPLETFGLERSEWRVLNLVPGWWWLFISHPETLITGLTGMWSWSWKYLKSLQDHHMNMHCYLGDNSFNKCLTCLRQHYSCYSSLPCLQTLAVLHRNLCPISTGSQEVIPIWSQEGRGLFSFKSHCFRNGLSALGHCRFNLTGTSGFLSALQEIIPGNSYRVWSRSPIFTMSSFHRCRSRQHETSHVVGSGLSMLIERETSLGGVWLLIISNSSRRPFTVLVLFLQSHSPSVERVVQ